MEKELIEQYSKQLRKANRVAIVLPDVVGVDLLGSALALGVSFEKTGKQFAMFSASKDIPTLGFFDKQPQVHKAFGAAKELRVDVSNKHVAPKQVRYEKTDQGLSIFISPDSESKESFHEDDVTVVPAATNFDLLVVLGAANFEELGDLYSNSTQFFFNTTKIALSTKPEHEYFAAVNIIDTEAAALSEVIFDLLSENTDVLKNDIAATGLLAGITSKTQSFKDARTRPSTLTRAAKLVQHGARQQDIIQHLFKTKSFKLLQLWGRAMARIKSFPEQDFLYTVLTQQDFAKTKTGPDMLEAVSKDLVEMSSSYGLVAIAAELPNGVNILLAGLPHVKLRRVAKSLVDQAPASFDLTPLISNYRYLTIHLPDVELSKVEGLLKQNLSS